MIGPLLIAAALVATPATLPQVLVDAAGGDVVTLADGAYATVAIAHRSFAPPLTIVAGQAEVKGVDILDTTGVVWRGGTLSAPKVGGKGHAGYAVSIFRSSGVTIADAAIGNAMRGIVMGAADNILVSNNRLVGFSVDGINIGSGSHDVTIDGNVCESFATGDAHPDCIQGWSRAGRPVADVVVTNNTARGRVQGIFFGNIPTRPGGGDPGFDRIRIEHNIVEVSLPNGILVADCRDCIVRDNTVSSLPGARFRAKVVALRGEVVTCGNTVARLDWLAAAQPCP
jgi:hypothetical protein